jgi:hypothetical protein
LTPNTYKRLFILKVRGGGFKEKKIQVAIAFGSTGQVSCIPLYWWVLMGNAALVECTKLKILSIFS